MKIALINASPKVNRSNSQILREDLKYYLADRAEIIACEMHVNSDYETIIEVLKTAQIWVFIYPLYIDGIPAHLLSFLVRLEEVHRTIQNVSVYCVVNCGFYEGIQNEISLKIMQNWCAKIGCIWGGGVGVGGGGGLTQMPKMKIGQGTKASIDRALSVLADRIIKGEPQENTYVSVNFPRFLYKMCAQIGWRQAIKANGGSVKDLGKKLD